MVEDTKESPPSQQSASEQEKKPAAPPVPPARPAPVAAAPPKPAAVPPKPPMPASAPPSKPVVKDGGRRGFIKAFFAIGAILSIVPFVPWGSFLSSSVETGSSVPTVLEKVRIDQNTKYGVASGALVNVNDLTTFPPNDHWVITYPTSGDPTLDSQNPDTFLKYELIRLPTELGGGSKAATDFVAFSKVCVHLWCSPNYNPTQSSDPQENGYSAGATKHQQYECPCHGSIYEVPDGKAVAGPASLQAFPSNAIPMLTLQADSSGQLWAVAPNHDPDVTNANYPDGGGPVADSIEANGELGYGRDFGSYNSFIKVKGQEVANPKLASKQVT